MIYVPFKITKEDYELLKDKSYEFIDDWLTDRLDSATLCGYGYYGCAGPFKNDETNEYYLEYYTGSSCD